MFAPDDGRLEKLNLVKLERRRLNTSAFMTLWVATFTVLYWEMVYPFILIGAICEVQVLSHLLLANWLILILEINLEINWLLIFIGYEAKESSPTLI